MGVVYRARDRVLEREVALKVLKSLGGFPQESIARFQREALAAAALDHPNIIRVHDAGTLEDGALFYAMELLRGQDLALASHLRRIGPKEAVEAIRQAALAAHYAHQRGILHRDIKPQNVFLQQDRGALAGVHVVLLDFGLAKLMQDGGGSGQTRDRGSARSLTQSGEFLGTPAFMSPEQVRDASGVDGRADVYSLGASLFHALAGRPPLEGASIAALLEAIRQRDPGPPSRWNSDVDTELDTICLRCLQKEPKDRYASAGALADDLGRWLEGGPISARPIGLVGRLWRKAKRNKAIAALIAALLVSVLGTASWFGVGAAVRAWKLASIEARHDGAMRARRFDDAAATAEEGRSLAPNDARWRERRNTALYEKAASVGRAESERWRAHRDRAAELAVTADRQADIPEPDPGAIRVARPSPEERDKKREQRWQAERSLRSEEIAREDAWSKASIAFTEALTHRVTNEAECALTELYWDRYVRAEVDRDTVAMRTYEEYVVQFGKEKYERELRGGRDVRVRFWLPPTFAGREVVAHLCEYRPCCRPPVLAPVPYDVARQRPVQDEVEGLTPEDPEWKPVQFGGARGPSPERVARSRGRALGACFNPKSETRTASVSPSRAREAAPT